MAEKQKRKRNDNFSDLEDRVLLEAFCLQYNALNGNFKQTSSNGAQLKKDGWEVVVKR